MGRVLIRKATYDNCREAVEEAFRLFPQAIEGRKVLIKPNALRASTPEEHITTHPALLRAVVEKVEEMRPHSIIVGDNPGVISYGQNEHCFRRTGLMEAAKGYYRNIGNDAVSMDFHPDYLPQVSVSRAVLEAEVFISLPKFKTHGLTVITGAIKNSYGILPGAQKAKLHRAAGSPERFHEVIVEVFRLRIPDLILVDAVVGMEGNGPASADLRDIGLILASDHAVALDAVIALMMGCDPGRLGFLQKAKEAGLGDYDPKGIEIIGKLDPLPDFQLPPLGGEASTANPAVQAFLESRTRLRPQADPEKCTACGTCVEQCPVSALTLEENLPVVNTDRCITCFCCQEMCPEKAISLR